MEKFVIETRPNGTKSVKIFCDPSKSKVKRSQKDECDINKIMKKAIKTGIINPITNQNMQYGDFSNIPSYREALDKVIHAENMFMQLDASIRKRFSNDPEQFLQFMADSKNKEEAIKLGLIEKPKDPETYPAKPAEPAAPVPPTGA